MAKLALCINTADAPLAYQTSKATAVFDHGPDFWRTPTRLIDRAICEKDESTLQLIPYIMLIDNGSWSLKSGPTRVFVYHRGEGGEENRLHGALSIGLGGHIDGEVPHAMTLQDWCAAEAVRELMEEVGLQGHHSEIIFANALVCDPTTEVSRVHAGILGAVIADPRRLGKHEAAVVEHGQWLTLEALAEPHIFVRLEPWSQAAVRYLVSGRGGLGL
jgi:predicted NUDIX family phosphoesterase